jgi:hypothetical protein
MSLRLAGIAALAAVGLATGGAEAAPQMLGVVASVEPIPMHCTNGTCAAELSSFCLQESRSMPSDGAAYQALDPDKLTLVVTKADGSTERVPAGPYVKLASARNYVAVSVSLSEAEAHKLGATAVAITVGPRLTLLPVATLDDSRPLTAEEIATARTALRAAATNLFDADTPRTREARLMNRLINALPTDEGGGPAEIL